VIPKQLFVDLPINAFTLPVCGGNVGCNRRLSKDEEYFRSFLLMQTYGERTPSQLWDHKVLPKLTPGYRSLLAQSIQTPRLPVPWFDRGLYLGEAKVFAADARRVRNVLCKIVRGLFYRHRGYHLRNDAELRSCHFDPRVKYAADAMTEVRRLMMHADRVVEHPDVFTYWFASAGDEAQSSGWWLLFYKKVLFMVTTNQRRPGETGYVQGSDEPCVWKPQR